MSMDSGPAMLSDSSRIGSVELYTTGQGSTIGAAKPWFRKA